MAKHSIALQITSHSHKGAGGHVFRERSEHHTFSLGASTERGYSFGGQFKGAGNGRNVMYRLNIGGAGVIF